jgi:hypothetical protein
VGLCYVKQIECTEYVSGGSTFISDQLINSCDLVFVIKFHFLLMIVIAPVPDNGDLTCFVGSLAYKSVDGRYCTL